MADDENAEAVGMREDSLGNEVAKDFEGFGVFCGRVVEYDSEGGEGAEPHYHIDWDDGDEEDLDPLEHVEARGLWLHLESGLRSSDKIKKKQVPVLPAFQLCPVPRS